MPPVRRRVISSWLRLRGARDRLVADLAELADRPARRRRGRRRLASVVSPRFVSEIVAAFENGRSAFVAPVRPGAALRRLTATGVACSAKRRSSTIVLWSSRSAFGNSSKPATMSSRRSAAAVAGDRRRCG